MVSVLRQILGQQKMKSKAIFIFTTGVMCCVFCLFLIMLVATNVNLS